MTIPNLTREQRLALADMLETKDVDVLKEMLQLVYSAAIQAQLTSISAPISTSALTSV